jgi:hypothetical protein
VFGSRRYYFQLFRQHKNLILYSIRYIYSYRNMSTRCLATFAKYTTIQQSNFISVYFVKIGSQMAVWSVLRAGHTLPPRISPVLISVRGWVNSSATVRLEGIDTLKNPLNSLGLVPATIGLAAQCPNQLRYACLPLLHFYTTYTELHSKEI